MKHSYQFQASIVVFPESDCKLISVGDDTFLRLTTIPFNEARSRVSPRRDWVVPAGITLFGDDEQWVNCELVAVNGPWTFQSEALVSSLQDGRLNFNDPTRTNVIYHGGYVQLLRFITDDHDHYNKKTGVLERVSPSRNFHCLGEKGNCGLCGMGAWQVGTRYNYLDLNDAGLNGGVLHNITSGLNWFWNPNSKFQFNYMATYRDVTQTPTFANGSGWIHGFGTRFAIDF